MIALTYDNRSQRADLVRNGRNIAEDPTLHTAVLISLFTRRRAADDDLLPDPRGCREGYWADPYSDVTGDLLGSRLWLLGRSKTTEATANQAKVYVQEALQWLIEDGVASSIDIDVERQGSTLTIAVSIVRPTDPVTRWSAVWRAHIELL